MFWNTLMTSKICNLLGKEDTTLYNILDEDDVLQECKGLNKDLINYLILPSNLTELVSLILTEPSIETDEKTRYKYPHVACELLTSEVIDIYEKLCSEDDLMNKLYGFIENEDTLNPLLASFYSKVMGLLISQKSDTLLTFLQSKDNFIEKLMYHMGTSAIMDFLLRLISCMEIRQVKLDCINWLNERNLINHLIDLIHPSQSEDKHCNSSQALCDIIRVSRQEIAQNSDQGMTESPLLNCIESKESLSRLLNNMFKSDKNESVLINGITVIRTLLEFRVMKADDDTISIDNTNRNTQKEEFEKSFYCTLDVVEQYFREFHDLLLEPPKQYYFHMNMTVGVLEPPLGNTRLQVARLISTMLLCYKMSFYNMLIELGTIRVLWELFFKYSFCNFFHTEVEKCIGTILMNAPCDEDNDTKKPLVIHLLKDCKLLEKIVTAHKDYVEADNKSCQKLSYMGHLYQISNHINDSVTKNDNCSIVKEVYSELPLSGREEWDDYVSGTLTNVNRINLITNMNTRTVPSTSEDDELELPSMHFPPGIQVQQAYSDFQIQQMSSNFTNSFGFHEEGFNESDEFLDAPFTNWKANTQFDFSGSKELTISERKFEEACNERMMKFDESNCDEDEWDEKVVNFGPFSSSTVHRVSGRSDDYCSQGNDSDGSSDSEDDLESPVVIKQIVSSSAEKMDVDPSAAWVDEFPEDNPAPIAMDTGVSWNTSAVTSSTDNNWANFDNDPFSDNGKSNDNWADFTEISSLDEAKLNLNSAMDTADVGNNLSRTMAYRINDSPNLETEVSSSDEISDSLVDGFSVKTELPSPVNIISETQVTISSDKSIHIHGGTSEVVNVDNSNSSEV